MSNSGDDYYKEYKRKMRESGRTIKNALPFLILSPLLIGGIVFGVLVVTNSDLRSEQKQEEKTNDTEASPRNYSSYEPQDNATQDQSSVMSYEEFSAQYQSEHSDSNNYAPTEIDQTDNSEAYRKYQEQLATNEAEKQRIADEQAALSLQSDCDSIRTSYNSAYKQAEADYRNTINNLSCPAYGGCPAKSNAENSFNSRINSIKSDYGSQWETRGCAGSL